MKLLSKLIQTLPDFKGKMRIASLLLTPLRKTKNIVITSKNGLQFYLPNLIEPVSKHLFVNGNYERDEINFIKNTIQNNGIKTFLDIGANIGLFSLNVAKHFPSVDIFAIEASPRVCNYLQKNVALNQFNNIQAIQLGLSHNDQAEMKFYSDETKFGTGSFAPIFTNHAEIVKCAKLDTLIDNKILPNEIGIIKVDVEGFELQVFQGAEKLLRNDKAPIILFEFVDWAEQNAGNKKGAAQEYLLKLNYELYKLQGLKLIPIGATIINGEATIIAKKR